DFDGDGDLDVVTGSQAGQGTEGISLFVNTGGTFASPVVIAPGLDVFDMVTGDLNGDGLPDLIASGSRQGINVLLGRPRGGFAAPAPIGAPGCFVARGDLDSDGHLDLVSACGTVTVQLGRGDGTFADRVESPTPEIRRLAVIDVDG